MADQVQGKNPLGPDGPQDPPPYSGNPPPGPPPPGVVVTTFVPGAVVIQAVGPKPTHTACRSCNREVVTRIERKATMRTHIMAGLLCLFACWPCVCVPYCIDSCLNTDHYCPNCGAFIGTYIS